MRRKSGRRCCVSSGVSDGVIGGARGQYACVTVCVREGGGEGVCGCQCGAEVPRCRSEAWEIRCQVRTIDGLGVLAGALSSAEEGLKRRGHEGEDQGLRSSKWRSKRRWWS
jgi:hypothetical protein